MPEPAGAADNKTQTKPAADVAVGPKRTLISGKIVFNDAIEIDLNKPLPAYTNSFITAYAARSLSVDNREYFAYVCEHAYIPRSRSAGQYAALVNPSLARLIGSGVATLPDGQGQRYVFIYENNLGKPLFEQDFGLTVGWKAERVLERVVQPLAGALKDMRDADIVHGSIRPTNLFDGGKENWDYVVLGDCLALPPSMAQPLTLEPFDRASAQPSGRGVGVIQDDLYALGVTVAMMIRTRDPMKGKTEQDIINQKMQVGTYATLLSPDDHLSGSIMEFLRGTLMDDERQRWNIDDVLAWLDGRRLSPKQSSKKAKAPRAISFNGKSFYYPAALARELFVRPQEAAQIVENNELEQWIKRSLDDDYMLKRYERGLLSATEQGRGGNFLDRLVSRIGIALDPEGPIRYKNVSITGEGLSTALAEAFVLNRDLPVFIEIINGTLLSYWMGICTDLNQDMSGFVSRFESCRNFIRQQGPGFGIERVLYFLNQDVHCLSPVLAKYLVRTPEEFIAALEQIAATDKRPTQILDRHGIAFLCVKDRKVAEPFLFELSSKEQHRNVLGTIQVLASIQRYYRIPALKNLTAWMCDIVEPLYDRYHDRELRKDLRRKVAEVRDRGDLNRLLGVIDNPDLQRNDLNSFRRAMRDYRLLTMEREDLDTRLSEPKYFGKKQGREASIVVSGVIAAIVAFCFIMLYVNGSKLF